MPLAQPLAEFRQNLEAQIREDLLFEALNTLLATLPDGSEKQRFISAFIARINAANKERRYNTISMEEHARMVSKVRADLLELIDSLTEADFEDLPETAKAGVGKSGKRGSVLYRVPHVMPIQKATRCTIRVALDEDSILENIVLDAEVQIKSRVEISDVMRAELVDAAGDTFKITPLNAPNQLVRDSGYTEWNFSVTPLREGVHQLLVKVSIMEIVPGFADPIPRDISVMETVTIVSERAVPIDGPSLEFKPSGEHFAFQRSSTAQEDFKINNIPPPYVPQSPSPSDRPKIQINKRDSNTNAPNPPSDNWDLDGPTFSAPNYSWEDKPPTLPPISNPPISIKVEETPNQNIPSEAPAPATSNRGLRTLAIFLAFLILAPSATWALSPELDRELFRATLQTKVTGSVALLEKFIQNHEENPTTRPYLEKAYFRRAEKTDSLDYLRLYQQKFGADGRYLAAVRQRIETHETNAIASIQAQPSVMKINQFVAKFPESERLPELKQAIEARAENRAENLLALENAYVASVQAQATETKVSAYLRDFPKQERLNEIAQAVAEKSEVLDKARPALEEAIARKMEAATSAAEVRQVLPALESAGSSAAATKIEKIVERKSVQVRAQVQQQVRQAGERVRGREKSAGDSKLQPDSSSMQNKLPESSKLSGSSKPEEKRNRRSGFEMISVAGGTYTMGDDTDSHFENCAHKVTVGSFSIGKYEVTQADWFEIMGTKPSYFKDCDECPVEQVSWDDIQDFLKALNKKFPGKNYRLPSEAEWEYAARGGNKTKGYQYAGSNDLKKVAWYNGNAGDKTHRVGELAANELGLYDMSGNVYEFCKNTWGAYPCDRTTESDKSSRVVRGGSWGFDPFNCRASYRHWHYSAPRYTFSGFRLAR